MPGIVELKTAVTMYMYKAYYDSLAMNIQKLFTLYNSVYKTRQCSIFKNKFVRTHLKSMCISVKGVKLRNSLDRFNVLSKCSLF